MTNLAMQLPDQCQQIKRKILDGSIGAISVDTCIFSKFGYRLDQGVLRRLEQFKENAFQMVFSEVTIRELMRHIESCSEEKKTKFLSGLKGVAKFWNIGSDKQSTIIKELLQELTPKELAKKRVDDFLTRCGAKVIEAKKALNVSQLLKYYFEVLPPFEKSSDKKAEFPDAIALLSLESWAEKTNASVLFVTNDKGCKRYCEQSRRIFAIDDLAVALEFIQARDPHRAQMCSAIDRQIVSGNHTNLLDLIKSTVSENIWSIDWIPDADASFYYEPEMQCVELISATFSSADGSAGLQPVDYCNGALIARATISIEVEALCSFAFSVKDGIDKDMVCIGGTEVHANSTVKVDVLITFLDPDTDNPKVDAVELVPASRHINFGFIEPDYSNEDPNTEFY